MSDEITIYKVDRTESLTESKNIAVGKNNHVLNDILDSDVSCAILRDGTFSDPSQDLSYDIGDKVVVVPEYEDPNSFKKRIHFSNLEVTDVTKISPEQWEEMKYNLKIATTLYDEQNSRDLSEYDKMRNQIIQDCKIKLQTLKNNLSQKQKYSPEPTLDSVIDKTFI